MEAGGNRFLQIPSWQHFLGRGRYVACARQINQAEILTKSPDLYKVPLPPRISGETGNPLLNPIFERANIAPRLRQTKSPSLSPSLNKSHKLRKSLRAKMVSMSILPLGHPLTTP